MIPTNNKTFILTQPQQVMQLIGYNVINNNQGQIMQPLYKLNTIQKLFCVNNHDQSSVTNPIQVNNPQSQMLQQPQHNQMQNNNNNNVNNNIYYRDPSINTVSTTTSSTSTLPHHSISLSDSLLCESPSSQCIKSPSIENKNESKTTMKPTTITTKKFQCKECLKMFKHECYVGIIYFTSFHILVFCESVSVHTININI